MRVIDMRCRPAYLHEFFGAKPDTASYQAARWLNRRVGTRGDDEHFKRSLTEEGFLAEIHDAGLTKAVVVGRHTPSQHITNDFLYEITNHHQQLLAIAGVDPVLQGVDVAIQEIDRVLDQLGFAGVGIEPGFAEPAQHPDADIYFPIYEHLANKGVPVFIMSGPTTPDLRFNNPDHLVKVAQTFPQLPIVCYHGYYPNTQQLVGVAFRYENVFVVPDMYGFLAGSEVFVSAANGFLADQLLFGSSYPFRPIKQSIEDFLQLGFKENIIDKLLYGNAANLLKL